MNTNSEDPRNTVQKNQRDIKVDDLNEAARAKQAPREQVAREMSEKRQEHDPAVADRPGQQEESQGIAASDPHQTNQNRTTTMHKSANRTPGEYAPSEGEDSGTAFGNDQQNPAG